MKDYPYWWDTLATESISSHQTSVPRRPVPGSPVPSDVLPSRVDVAIIGAGYTGLSAARHLARSGASVLVFERNRVGAGASSRNGGQVLTGLKLDPATLVDRYGESKARRLFEIGGASISRLEALIAEERIDCDYARTGHLQLASKPSHFKMLEDEQTLLARVFNHRVELVPRAEQRSEIGADGYHGLLLDERSGALNPAKYVEGLAAAATQAGATIATHQAVTALENVGGGWRVKAERDLEAREVLVATNGYTTNITPALQRRLIPIGSFIIATEPLAADTAAALLPKRRVAFDSMNFLHYFRITSDRRLLFGGRAEFRAPDRRTASRAAAILRADMIRTFPELRNTRVDYSWGGNVAFSRDQMPRAGRIEGLYYAGGYCGHGIAMATYLGEQIARRIAGEPVEHPLFDDHFAPIPLYHGTPWFLPMTAAYYKVKDWLT